MEKTLPAIPAKRYFTIGEVSELCGVKPYVLRYWEQEFSQLKPMKRRGNRRYYQHHEVLLIRRIRELLYDQGFTIVGARNRLVDAAALAPESIADAAGAFDDADDTLDRPVSRAAEPAVALMAAHPAASRAAIPVPSSSVPPPTGRPVAPEELRRELHSIRELLTL
jgi:DNA-binding transcriptional MerR regulator